jgi:hypothetical protein
MLVGGLLPRSNWITIPSRLSTSNQWIAYHADERIGFAQSPFELYGECFRRGFKEEEFVVRRIMEEITPGSDCTPPWDA